MEPVAIVGIGCRFPGADGPVGYWRLLAGGVDAISEVPPERFNLDELYDEDPSAPGKMNTRWGGFLTDVERFDAGFFGITPREAAHVDPQQRLLMEVAWEAMEDGGLVPERLAGKRVGVFVGMSSYDYGSRQLAHFDTISDGYVNTGSALSIAANRLSYLFDFRGPSLVIDTACSSSLVSAFYACQSLARGESEIALAGGVNLILSPAVTIGFSKLHAMAPDGRCKAFDARADGYVRGEGAGVVVLKPLARALEDGDRVYAVIRGGAVNQDGRTNGLTAPNGLSQEALLREALASASVGPSEVAFVEAHGTGTALGDPIELNALGAALAPGRGRDERCAVGSVKTNFGHLEAAAGIAGLIKVALALDHRQVPPSLHFETPNPYIRFDVLPLRVPTRLEALPEEARPAKAGISSFGFGGTNAHLVLEEPPRPRPGAGVESADTEASLLAISARSDTALRALADAYARFLREGGATISFSEICGTAANRRPHHDFRLAAVASDSTGAAAKLEGFVSGELLEGVSSGRRLTARRRKVAFVFPGQGSQWLGMGRELFEREPVFRESIEATAAAFAEHVDDWSLLKELRASEEASQLDRVDVIQPAIFAIQVALAALWREWGIKPDAVVGHSMGEVAAAQVAGALGLDDAARIICLRSRLAKRSSGRGAMAVVDLGFDQAREALSGLEDRLAVAVSNSPTSSVLSGDPDALEEVLEKLEREEVFCRRVKVDYASHSPQMDSLKKDLYAILADVAPRAARIPLYSTVTASVAAGTELDASYWVRNLREPVLFAGAIEKLLQDRFDVFLEVSPHPVLLPAIQQSLHHWDREGVALGSLERDAPERPSMLETLAGLYALGRNVEWSRVQSRPAVPLGLPRYPWQRERHWMDEAGTSPRWRATKAKNPFVGEHVVAASGARSHFWQREIGTSSFPFLADHRVQGEVVLPASAYLEMALEAGQEALGNQAAISVEGARFERPLVLSEDEVTVQVALTSTTGSRHRFQIFSRESAEVPWTLHASGELHEGDGERTGDLEALDTIERRCPLRVDADEHYRRMDERHLQYGDAFRTVARVSRGKKEALACLKPSGTDAARYQLHPALLDGAFQALAQALPEDVLADGTTYVPVAVDLVRAVAVPPSGPLFAHAVCSSSEDGGLRGSVRLLSEDGRLIAEALGLRLERLSPAEGDEEAFYEIQWEPAPREASRSVERRSWLVLDGSPQTAAEVASKLEARGASARVARVSEGLDRLLEEVRPEAVVHLGGLDAPDAPPPWESALQAIQSLARRSWGGSLRLVLVSRGAQPIRESDEVLPAQATLWGLARTAAQELSELACTAVDVAPSPGDEDRAALVEELVHAEDEQQVALRGGLRWVARLSRAKLAPRPVTEGATPPVVRAEVSEPGNLDSIQWRVVPRPKPDDHEVTIETAVIGLNFRDVFRALRLIPPEADGTSPIGLEGAGRIAARGASVEDLQVGDEVIALARGSLASVVRTDAALVAKRPERLSLADAATLPVALLTAHYALHHMAHLKPGERVLIHSATGAVGLACLRFARALGAEVYATAGTEAKRRLLETLGVSRAMDSRSLDFADEIRRATKGEGVDVVVNSLAGEAVRRGVSLLRPGGRFIELGMRDLLEGGQVPLEWLANNRSFIVVDLNRLARERPGFAGELLREALARFEELELSPIPKRLFPAAELADAFRHFARAEHVGKILISMEEHLRDVAPPTDAAALVRDDRTYLVTGGLGGIGLVTARWLVGKGARHLALWGRSAPAPEAREAIASMERAGARVETDRVDVSDREQVETSWERLERALPPVAGLFHAAGVLDDGILVQQTAERFRRVMAPKIQGALHLDRVSRAAPLDVFVLFSSAASVLGSPGQAGYAAANQFLDALAHRRRRQGLPAVSINWGPWSEVGLAARPDRAGRLAARGLASISPRAGMAALERILLSDASQVSVLFADWTVWLEAYPGLAEAPQFRRVAGAPSKGAAEPGLRAQLLALPPDERGKALVERLRSLVASVLRIPPPKLDVDQPLLTMGIDSLMAVELKNRVQRELGAEIPLLQLVKGPSLAELGGKLLEQMTGEAGPPAPTESGREAAGGKSLLLSLLSLKDGEEDEGR